MVVACLIRQLKERNVVAYGIKDWVVAEIVEKCLDVDTRFIEMGG